MLDIHVKKERGEKHSKCNHQNFTRHGNLQKQRSKDTRRFTFSAKSDKNVDHHG
jgi:hypothetical protein